MYRQPSPESSTSRTSNLPPLGACVGIAIATYGLLELAERLDAYSTSSGVPHGGLMLTVAVLAFVGFLLLRIFRGPDDETGVGARVASTLRAFLLVAAVVVPIFSLPYVSKKQNAVRLMAGVKSDLRLIAARQDSAFASTGRYHNHHRQLGIGMSQEFGPHIQRTKDGWSATQTFDESIARCAIFVGSTPVYPASAPRELVCANRFPMNDVIVGIGLLVAGLALAVILNRRAPVEPLEPELAAASPVGSKAL